MTALPSFINSRIRRGDFQRRVHRGVRRDRFDSGAVAQRKLWDGERIEERISARVRRADLPAWRDFLRETNGGAGWFDYQVPGTNPVRTVRARIIGGDIRERVLDGAGENTLLQMRIEWRNAKRAWLPSDAIADKFVRWVGIWGHPTYISGDPAVNQIIGGDDADVSGTVTVSDAGTIQCAAASEFRVTFPSISAGQSLLICRSATAAMVLDAKNRIEANGTIVVNNTSSPSSSGDVDKPTATLIYKDGNGIIQITHANQVNTSIFYDVQPGGWADIINTSQNYNVMSAAGEITLFAAVILHDSNGTLLSELESIRDGVSDARRALALAEWSDS